MSFVPDDFEPPLALTTESFELEPLGPEHNDEDYAAWTSSIDHIHASPDFADERWPYEMTLEDNRRDLERHRADFDARRGFTYTVREPGGGRIIGCVYIYPKSVQSWVVADRAELDEPLRTAVREWIRDWPLATA